MMETFTTRKWLTNRTKEIYVNELYNDLYVMLIIMGCSYGRRILILLITVQELASYVGIVFATNGMVPVYMYCYVTHIKL